MTQRKALVIDAGHQAFDELDATDIPALAYDATGTAAAAVAALSSVYQPLDSDLTALAGLAIAADKLPYGTGSHTLGLADLTAFGRSLIDDAAASNARTTLGLGTAAVAATGDFDAAGAAAAAQSASQPADAELTAIAGLTSAANKVPYFTGSGTAAVADFTAAGRAIVDDADASAQRTTLGLGTLATQSGTFSGTSSGTNTGDQTLVLAGTGLFGTGSDGSVTLQQSTAAPAWATKGGAGATTTFTLTRDVFFTTADFDDSAGNYLVATAGFRIFANVQLTIDAGVTVNNDGKAGSGGTAGGNATGNTVGVTVSAGSAGGVNTTASAPTAVAVSAAQANTSPTAHGGAGGAATGGGTGGGVAGGNASIAANLSFPYTPWNALSVTPQGNRYAGGGGGTGGNATGGATATGGGGGGGGGVCLVAALKLINNGVIRALGGAGGNGAIGNGTGAGGGGGGGGGVVIVVYGSGSTVGTLTVTGGGGGTLAGAGATGGTGVSGLSYSIAL